MKTVEMQHEGNSAREAPITSTSTTGTNLPLPFAPVNPSPACPSTSNPSTSNPSLSSASSSSCSLSPSFAASLTARASFCAFLSNACVCFQSLRGRPTGRLPMGRGTLGSRGLFYRKAGDERAVVENARGEDMYLGSERPSAGSLRFGGDLGSCARLGFVLHKESKRIEHQRSLHNERGWSKRRTLLPKGLPLFAAGF